MIKGGGESIFQYYEKYGLLDDYNRKQLVNLTVTYLVQKYGITMSREIKRETAESLIELFPKLRDPSSPRGYVSIY